MQQRDSDRYASDRLGVWVTDNGGDVEKLRIMTYDEGWRGVHAAAPIQGGDQLLYIPLK